jgi:hypothetical protein
LTKRVHDALVTRKTALMYTGAGGLFSWGAWTVSMTLGLFVAGVCVVALEILSDGSSR